MAYLKNLAKFFAFCFCLLIPFYSYNGYYPKSLSVQVTLYNFVLCRYFTCCFIEKYFSLDVIFTND